MSHKWKLDHKDLENGGKAGHQDFLLFPYCFENIYFLNTGKIVHFFHLKAVLSLAISTLRPVDAGV